MIPLLIYLSVGLGIYVYAVHSKDERVQKELRLLHPYGHALFVVLGPLLILSIWLTVEDE